MAETIGAGFNLCYYGFNDADGYFLGGSLTAPTAGDQDGSPLTRLTGGRTIPVGIPEPTIVPADGDDQTYVSFQFDPADLPSGVLETVQRNDNFEANIQGTVVDVDGNIRVGVLDPRDRADQAVCWLFMSVAKTTAGAVIKEHLYVDSTTCKPLYKDITQREFSPYRYSINVSRSARLAWTTVNDSEHGTTAASLAPIRSNYPVMVCRWTGDNAETVFNLNKSFVAGTTAKVYVNDVKQAVTTNYNIAGTALTFLVAPADNARIVAVWEYPAAEIG
jgi:hypothetical protein